MISHRIRNCFVLFTSYSNDLQISYISDRIVVSEYDLAVQNQNFYMLQYHVLPQGLFFQLYLHHEKKACLIDIILISSPGFKVFLQIAINFCLQENSMTTASMKHVRLPMIPWVAYTLICMPLFVRLMELVLTGGTKLKGNAVSREWSVSASVRRPRVNHTNWTIRRHGQALFASCIPIVFQTLLLFLKDWKAECKVAGNV